MANIVTRPENKTMTDLQSNNNLIERYQGVCDAVNQLCTQHASQVTLLAVSKKHPIESIEQIYQQGQRCFGENYVQEGVEKAQALRQLDIEWHFIGPIQSNKSRQVAEHFDWVHTIDREKIAQRLNDQRPSHSANLNVLIQVNISQQDSKSGIHINEVPELAKAIMAMPKLTLRGLMCIPAPSDERQLRTEFLAMKQAYEDLRTSNPQVDTLSMGMSSDLSLAIECSSTMVRIGTAIFGQRN